MQDKTPFGSCVDNPFDSVDELIEIIDNATEITFEEFIVECDTSGLGFEFDQCLKCTMRDYPNDFSYYRNEGIYFYVHSAIEHFFK